MRISTPHVPRPSTRGKGTGLVSGTLKKLAGLITVSSVVAATLVGGTFMVGSGLATPTAAYAADPLRCNDGLYVAFNRDKDTQGLVQVDVKSVKPGQKVEWKAEAPLKGDDLTCVLRAERFAPQK